MKWFEIRAQEVAARAQRYSDDGPGRRESVGQNLEVAGDAANSRRRKVRGYIRVEELGGALEAIERVPGNGVYRQWHGKEHEHVQSAGRRGLHQEGVRKGAFDDGQPRGEIRIAWKWTAAASGKGALPRLVVDVEDHEPCGIGVDAAGGASSVDVIEPGRPR